MPTHRDMHRWREWLHLRVCCWLYGFQLRDRYVALFAYFSPILLIDFKMSPKACRDFVADLCFNYRTCLDPRKQDDDDDDDDDYDDIQKVRDAEQTEICMINA